jgi:hypothetical protein
MASPIGCVYSSLSSMERGAFGADGRATTLSEAVCSNRPSVEKKRQVSFSDELQVFVIPAWHDDKKVLSELCSPPEVSKPDPKETARLQSKLFSAMDRFKSDRCRRTPAAA